MDALESTSFCVKRTNDRDFRETFDGRVLTSMQRRKPVTRSDDRRKMLFVRWQFPLGRDSVRVHTAVGANTRQDHQSLRACKEPRLAPRLLLKEEKKRIF
jgi:hypothetical protein